MIRSSVIALVILAAIPAHGWWCLGHMLVGHIAHKTMNPTVAQQVSQLVQGLGTCGKFPLTPDLMQVGCWPDDLKAMGLYAMSGWHFVDLPYNPSNLPVPDLAPENVETITDDLMKASRNPTAQNGWVLSFAIANLIHFFGDIHQPLHAITLYSDAFPNGDRGGNAIKVTVEGNPTNLHSVWDSICYQYFDPARPLNANDRAEVDAIADRLIATYQFSATQSKVWNTTTMALESYADAVKYVYPGVQSGDTLTEDYIQRCIPVAEGRVTLAGLRLGNELNYLFSTFETHQIPAAIYERMARYHAGMTHTRHRHFGRRG